MRIATITFQQNAMSQMQELQAALAKTQNDLATSKKLHSAADDPAAMTQVNQLNITLSASTQYVTNGNSASTNLKLEEQAMADATNTLQGIRDLAVQANNAGILWDNPAPAMHLVAHDLAGQLCLPMGQTFGWIHILNETLIATPTYLVHP